MRGSSGYSESGGRGVGSVMHRRAPFMASLYYLAAGCVSRDQGWKCHKSGVEQAECKTGETNDRRHVAHALKYASAGTVNGSSAQTQHLRT